MWSERCVQQHWDLAHFISSLEEERWAKHLCNGSLTAAHGVVGQPTYGTLSSQTSANGKAFNIGLESRTRQSWMAMLPDFLHFVNLYMRPGLLQWRARFRAQAAKNTICTQLLFTCARISQRKQNVSSTRRHPFLSMIPVLRTCNTHEIATIANVFMYIFSVTVVSFSLCS